MKRIIPLALIIGLASLPSFALGAIFNIEDGTATGGSFTQTVSGITLTATTTGTFDISYDDLALELNSGPDMRLEVNNGALFKLNDLNWTAINSAYTTYKISALRDNTVVHEGTVSSGQFGTGDLSEFSVSFDGIYDELIVSEADTALDFAIDNIDVVLVSAPTVTTATALSVTPTSATLGGNVTSDGGASVTARGIVWATTSNPALGGGGVTTVVIGSGTGAFSSNVSGLPEASTIYVRAYATNSVATTYGSQVSFSTPASNTAPSVSSPVADFSVAENTANNTLSLTDIFSDGQQSDASLVFSVQSNTNSGLVSASIDNTADLLTLDYAGNTTGAATLVIRATDSGSLFIEDSFTVTVTDVDPVIVDGASASVPEDSPAGTFVATMSTTGDNNGLVWSIAAGNTGNAFAINSATGVITVAGPLDYESLANYTLTVAVDDEDADTVPDDTATVLITVTDVDEVPPTVDVMPLVTNDPSPELNGGIDDPTASVSITVGGQTHPAANNGNGTWTLAGGVLDPLPLGVFDVEVTATDSAGNAGLDATSGELEIVTDWAFWQQQNGVSGADENPDGDAWSNLFEFLFAMDPGTFNLDDPIRSSVDSNGITTWTFVRRADLGGLQAPVVRAASNPLMSGATVLTEVIEENNGATLVVSYTDTGNPVDADNPRYFQIEVNAAD